MEVFACIFEIEQNGNIQRQRMEAPRIMIEQQFTQLVQQAANSTIPIRIKMMRNAHVWNQLEKKWIDNNVTDYKPASIEVQLMRDGQPYGAIVTLSEENGWKYEHDAFSGLCDKSRRTFGSSC